MNRDEWQAPREGEPGRIRVLVLDDAGNARRPVVVAGVHGDGTVAPVVSQVLLVQVLPVPAVVK